MDLYGRCSPSKCALGSRGECVSQQQLLLSATSPSSSPSVAYFSGRSYCAAGDAACTRCAAQWHADFGDASELPAAFENATCVGDGGCLCLAACELPAWETRVLALTQCGGGQPTQVPPTSTSNNNTSDTSPPSVAAFLIAGAACLALVAVFALISLWLAKFVRKMDGNAQQMRLNRFRLPVRVPSGPQLQLEGWTAMREKLVQDRADATVGAPSLAPPSLTASMATTATPTDSSASEERRLWIRW